MQFETVYKDLPKNILFIYTEICNTKYGIINHNADFQDKHLLKEACQFLFENSYGNIIVNRDFAYRQEWLQSFESFIDEKRDEIA